MSTTGTEQLCLKLNDLNVTLALNAEQSVFCTCYDNMRQNLMKQSFHTTISQTVN